ncbi:MAG TPA: STAS domain-containing protein [Candidatus Sulfopaludibacter sp.]|jgi:anti-anti-sigma factor|nr:STAS domain-containing protein [Candidatus Sulfopaludibacter sp.]
MEIQRHQRPDHLELSIEGRLDGYWAQHLSTSVADVMREGTHAVRLNLSRTSYISSAGVGVLVEMYKNFSAINGSFRVIEPSRQVLQILEMVGLAGMLFGTAAAPAVPIAVRRKEAGGVIYEIHDQAPGSQLSCRLMGDPGRLASADFAAADCRVLPLSESRLALGLGAFGDDFDHCRDRFGEFLALSGAGAFQPTDGTNFPDYMVGSGNFVPRLSTLYGLCCDGPFSHLVRFETAAGSDAVTLSALVANCMDIANAESAAVVILAESAGLVGAALKRSPIAPLSQDASLFAYPDVRRWLSFSPERSHSRALALIGGVASLAPPAELRPFVRPLARSSGIAGHFHAAAFGYRPLKKGELDLKTAVRGLFDGGGLEGVLHLLADHRDIAGAGESEFLRGACWVGPIGQFRSGDQNS